LALLSSRERARPGRHPRRGLPSQPSPGTAPGVRNRPAAGRALARPAPRTAAGRADTPGSTAPRPKRRAPPRGLGNIGTQRAPQYIEL